MNQPRSGIRGVTIDDVSNVERQGSSAMRGGYTFTRPGQQSAPGFNVQELIRGMTASPLNTAGERYSGYPTASAQEAAILGSIVPFYAIGDYARQLATQRLEDIGTSTAGKVREMYGPELLEQNALGPVAIPGAGNVAPAQVAARNVLDPGYQAAKLAADKAWAELGIAKITRGTPERLTYLQDVIDNGLELYPEEKTEYENLLAGQRAAYSDAFAKQQAAEDAQAALALASRNATSARLAGATGAAAAAQQQVGREVTPNLQLAEQIAEVPRYQLAQQMATQYFGMDPALAAGTFTPALDADYMQMQRDLQNEQNLALGIDPTATIADTLLRNDPSGASLREYQDALAEEAQRKLFEGQNSVAEDEFDANLEMATGISMDTAAGDFSKSTARYYLNDPVFMDVVQQSITDLQTAELPLGLEPADRVAQIANAYANQYADPIGAVILANILGSFSPIVPTGG